MLVVTRLRRDWPIGKVEQHLRRLAAQHGGLAKEGGLFLPAAPDAPDSCRGYAVLELRHARQAVGCASALQEDTGLRQDAALEVFPLQLHDKEGRLLLLPRAFEAGGEAASDEHLAAVLSAHATVLSRSASTDGNGEGAAPRNAIDAFLRSRLLEDSELAPDLQYALLSLVTGGTHGGMEAGVAVDMVLRASAVTVSSNPGNVTPAALVRTFLEASLGGQQGDAQLQAMLAVHSTDGMLRVSHLLTYVMEQVQAAPQQVAHALLLLGYDLHLQRLRDPCRELATSAMLQQPWTPEADAQLVAHADALARAAHMSPLQLAACDIELSAADLMDKERRLLQPYAPKDVRLRLALLQTVNAQVGALLPVLDLRAQDPRSAAAAVRSVRPLLFYAVQCAWLDNLLDETAQRVESTGPEISLDPLAGLPRRASGGGDVDHGAQSGAMPRSGLAADVQAASAAEAAAEATAEAAPGERPSTPGSASPTGPAQSHFEEARLQLEPVHPAELRTKLAKGGDPIFPVVVRLTGERVAGNSGSFRDFMLRMAHELQSDALPLLMLCPSAALGHNVGRWILRPGPHTFLAVKRQRFFGLLLGLALRSGVPLPLDLLPCFWKALVGVPLTRRDLAEADKLSADALATVIALSTPAAFQAYVATHPLTFSVRLMNGEERLLPGPKNGAVPPTAGKAVQDKSGGLSHAVPAALPVTWETRDLYVAQATAVRLAELSNSVAVAAVCEGLECVVPPEVLQVVAWRTLELRTCGVPDVDLAFLRRHTTYTMGLGETDPHVVFFWEALERMSAAERRMFIKFACNQERIPSAYADMDEGETLRHVPPYPMKIALPDDAAGGGAPDDRLIRAETCMFMVKLPQYSSLEVTLERLRQAISCRDDPLIG